MVQGVFRLLASEKQRRPCPRYECVERFVAVRRTVYEHRYSLENNILGLGEGDALP